MADAEAPEGITGKLTDKVGPLPLWAWGVLTIVGILAYEAFAHRSSTPTAATDNAPTDAQAQTDTSGDVNAPAATGWANTEGTGGLYALQAWFAWQEAQHVMSGGPRRAPDPGLWLRTHPRAIATAPRRRASAAPKPKLTAAQIRQLSGVTARPGPIVAHV